MANEAISWPEGTAYIVTGGASSVAAYAQGISVNMAVSYHKYRPPHGTTTIYRELDRVATMSIDQLWSQKDYFKMLNAATAGGVHVRLLHVVGPQEYTGEVILWSGVLTVGNIAGQNAGLMAAQVQGEFPLWTGNGW